MNRILRIVTTLLIISGLAYIWLYFFGDKPVKTSVFDYPSYYQFQNWWFIFVSGICILLFGVLASFFSWQKKLDKREDVIPNAVSANIEEISSWVEGTSLDTQKGVLSSESGEKLKQESASITDNCVKETEIIDGNDVVS